MISLKKFIEDKTVETITLECFTEEFEDSTPEYSDKVNKLINQFSDGDSILYFISAQSAWDIGEGIEGYLLVRGEQVVDSLTTKIN